MAITQRTAACKRTGKGTEVAFQKACTDTGTVDFDPTASNTAGWMVVGCLFGVQPPGVSYDTITGEQCLSEGAVPTTELGDIQADNPTFTVPFCPDDEMYCNMVDYAECGECMLFCFSYPGGARDFFFARIQEMTPDEISRDDFSRTTITLLRTSQVWRSKTDADTLDIPTSDDGFDCDSCRDTPAAQASVFKFAS